MLDKDLAELYKVTTSYLNKTVKRNLKRFPDDFMFQLKADEFKNLMFQNGTSSLPDGKAGWGGVRKNPFAFTEQGVAMLAGVPNRDIAIEGNIPIIRIFARLRGLLLAHKDVLLKPEQMEKQVIQNSDDIRAIFSAPKELLNPPREPRHTIGFKLPGKKKK